MLGCSRVALAAVVDATRATAGAARFRGRVWRRLRLGIGHGRLGAGLWPRSERVARPAKLARRRVESLRRFIQRQPQGVVATSSDPGKGRVDAKYQVFPFPHGSHPILGIQRSPLQDA